MRLFTKHCGIDIKKMQIRIKQSEFDREVSNNAGTSDREITLVSSRTGVSTRWEKLPEPDFHDQPKDAIVYQMDSVERNLHEMHGWRFLILKD